MVSSVTGLNYYSYSGTELRRLRANADARELDILDIEQKFEKKEYGVFEYCIFKALSKYQILNRFNLNAILQSMLPDGKPDYIVNVKKLYSDGCLLKLQNKEHTFYTLSHCAYRYMQQKGGVSYSFRVFHQLDTEQMLAIACVGQYHISVITKNNVKKEEYYKTHTYRRVGVVTIPSVIEYRGYSLIAVPIGKEDITVFFQKFFRMVGYLENIKRPLFVLLASSSKEAIDTIRLLNNIPESPMSVFLLDIDTGVYNPLESLKMIHFDEDGIAQIGAVKIVG